MGPADPTRSAGPLSIWSSMPRRAPSPCKQQGCPALTSDRWCPEHRKAADQRDRDRRGTAAERGYGRRWADYSKQYRRDHPWCVRCQRAGRQTPTEQVDHITPVRGPRDPLFWDPKNHQALCMSCHSSKTVAEDHRGIGAAWR